MSNLIHMAKKSIDKMLQDACASAAAAGIFPEGAALTGSVEIPKDVTNGDYAANHAMTGARALHMAPRKIAEALVESIDLTGSWFSSVEIAGPGLSISVFRINGMPMCLSPSPVREWTTAGRTKAGAEK